MSEQAGFSVAAIQTRQAALVSQHGVAAEADQVLEELVASAHAAMRASIRQLDAISAEIDHAVSGQADRGIDTPLGAREFQTFLVAKQREIAAIVGRAHELDRAKAAVLESLRVQYAGSAG
jgi:predicted component of type VI protein secretion system